MNAFKCLVHAEGEPSAVGCEALSLVFVVLAKSSEDCKKTNMRIKNNFFYVRMVSFRKFIAFRKSAVCYCEGLFK